MHKSTETSDYNQSLQAETQDSDETSDHSGSDMTDDQQTNHQDQDRCPYSLRSREAKRRSSVQAHLKGG